MAIIEHLEAVAPARDVADVLCAVDGSAAGTEAMRQALALAPCAASLRFISVVDASGHRSSFGEHAARRALQHAQAVALTYGVHAQAELVRDGDPAAVLLARSTDETILVAGIHGSSRVAGAIGGSVATALAHRARGPLLVARDAGAPFEVPRRILVAVDDDDNAASAVRLAGTIAARCGGYVHIVHVQGHDYGAHTRHRLAVLSTDLIEQTGAEPMIDVLRGSQVAAQIGGLARRCGSSLLVVGRRGLSGLPALGSVSERLVHTAPCSVLLVPRSPVA